MFKGLVFTFAGEMGEFEPQYFRSFEEFKRGIVAHEPAIRSLWRQLCNPSNVILRLDLPEEETPLDDLCIDINEFQAIMPPITTFDLVNDSVITDIWTNLMSSAERHSDFDCGLLQANLPYIRRRHVTEVHEVFSLE